MNNTIFGRVGARVFSCFCLYLALARPIFNTDRELCGIIPVIIVF
jgi:hypothetical protein